MELLGLLLHEVRVVPGLGRQQLGVRGQRVVGVAEMPARQLAEGLVVDVAGGRHDHRRRHVVLLVVGPDRRVVQAPQGRGRADDLPPQRMLVEHRLGQVVVDQLRRRVLVERDLFEHDLALALEVGEQRPGQHVGHDRERLVEMLVQEARVDERVLLGGGGVELAAHLVERTGDIEGGVAPRAFEDEVLDQVGDAAEARVLVA